MIHDEGERCLTLHPILYTRNPELLPRSARRKKKEITKKRMGSVLNLQDYFPKRDILRLLKVEH